MNVLITGAAGFIGFHLAERMLADGWDVCGVDNMNDYYDVSIKDERIRLLSQNKRFSFHRVDISDIDQLDCIFIEVFDLVINLAGQVGVRYSVENPRAYIVSNIIGFFNVLECCRRFGIKRVMFASSSSVYGGQDVPFREDDRTDEPMSMYAVTKKTNELMAYSYSNLHGMDIVGLRFFTVYGPFGRPDMAIYSFAKNILAGKPITLYNYGYMGRSFTYISDVVESVVRLTKEIPNGFSVVNVGNDELVDIKMVVKILEENLGKEAILSFSDKPISDPCVTMAHTEKLQNMTGYRPETSIEDGIEMFVNWFKGYHE